MTPLELKKTKTELLGVAHARAVLEVRVEEMLEEIERLKKNITIQENKEAELKAKVDSATK